MLFRSGTDSGVQVIKVKQGNSIVGTIWTSQAKVDGNVLTLPLDEAITAEGEYTIAFPANVVTAVNGMKYAGETFTFVVEAAEPEVPEGIEEIAGDNAVKAIYDITGRKIENITKGGIYIVNGKKVLVK